MKTFIVRTGSALMALCFFLSFFRSARIVLSPAGLAFGKYASAFLIDANPMAALILMLPALTVLVSAREATRRFEDAAALVLTGLYLATVACFEAWMRAETVGRIAVDRAFGYWFAIAAAVLVLAALFYHYTRKFVELIRDAVRRRRQPPA